MIDSKISNVQNASDALCNWIIELLSHTCKYYGITYGELNMMLLSIGILLICSYSIGAILNNRRILLFSLYATIISFFGMIVMFGLVPLPNSMF